MTDTVGRTIDRMGMDILIQQGVQTGIINGAGIVVTLAGLAITVAWWAYLYR